MYVNSMLSPTEIEELVNAELDSAEEVNLNKFLLPESFSFEALKMHVQSIICSCGQEEVSFNFFRARNFNKNCFDHLHVLLSIHRKHISSYVD